MSKEIYISFVANFGGKITHSTSIYIGEHWQWHNNRMAVHTSSAELVRGALPLAAGCWQLNIMFYVIWLTICRN